MDDSRAPVGIRSNNPGNLRPGRQRWIGETTPAGGSYCTFDTADHGLRALAIDLHTKYFTDQLTTIEDIVTRYAPPSENDTEAYIADVCQRTGFLRDAWYPLHEPNAFDALMKAIIWHENGQCPYTDWQIAQAVVSALGSIA